MEAQLKQKTLAGMAWRGIERSGAALAQFVVSVMLARLLVPEQFGLIAMLSLFVQVAGILVACELPAALIQKKDASHADECSVFYFNVAVALAAYAALFLAAPLAARFYAQPQLALLLRVLALRIVVGAFGGIHQTLLTKRIDFKAQLKVGWAAMLAGGVAGVAMAYGGLGVWALVGQQLVSALVGTLLLWIVSPWRPALVFRPASLRRLFGFSSKLLAAQFIGTVFDNIYLVAIGRFFSPVALGHYHRANSLPTMLMGTVNDTVASVMFPAYATIQHDHALMRRAVQRSLKMLCFVVTPLLVGLCATAEPVVRILLTDKWLPCVPYLRIISLVCIWTPFHIINLQVIMALGRSDLFLGIEVAKMLVDAVVIAAAYRFGMTALVASQMLTAVVSLVLNSCFSKRLVGYSTLQQLADTAPVIFLGVFMGAVAWGVGELGFSNQYARLLLQMAAGVAVYLGGGLLMRLDSLAETIAMVRQYLLPRLRRAGR